MMSTVTLVLLAAIVHAAMSDDTCFNYEQKGADWTEPGWTCLSGKAQSPIDVTRSELTLNDTIEDITLLNYEAEHEMHTVQHCLFTNMAVMQGDDTAKLRGVGLADEYYLLQVHLHMAQTPKGGSEHTFHGKHYPIEISYRRRQVGCLISDSKPDDPILKEWTEEANEHNGTTFNLTDKHWLKHMKRAVEASGADFIRYDGSLTTPTCAEKVEWILLAKPIHITTKLYKEMQKLHLKEMPKLHLTKPEATFRPTQAVNGRTVYRKGQMPAMLAQSGSTPAPGASDQPSDEPSESTDGSAPEPYGGPPLWLNVILSLLCVFLIVVFSAVIYLVCKRMKRKEKEAKLHSGMTPATTPASKIPLENVPGIDIDKERSFSMLYKNKEESPQPDSTSAKRVVGDPDLTTPTSAATSVTDVSESQQSHSSAADESNV